jgi:CheY-like chemotaxis protein
LTTRISLLVAEDETLIRLAMQDLLESGGFEVISVSSGEAAMSLILQASRPFSGLITDIRLGGEMDGWALALNAREQNPDISVLYVTGDSAADWSAKGVPRSLVLQKPVADAQILTGISALLND